MKLSAGPLLFYWEKQQVFDFYDSVKKMPVDIVYLGEVVCARRHELRTDDWLQIARELTDAGKEVVLSTQGLLESESDLNRVRKIAQNGLCRVEANDLGAIMQLAEHKVPFVAGMHLNIYNATTLAYYAKLGCFRWVPPVEMSRDVLIKILETKPDTVETEIFCYGKMPLAFSARCFTARHYGLNKDDCQFKCQEHADGLILYTQENQAFLSLNGIQTQSAQSANLIDYIDDMQAMGIEIARLSPQMTHYDEIVSAFDDKRHQRPVTLDWSVLTETGHCNGYWLGNPGINYTDKIS